MSFEVFQTSVFFVYVCDTVACPHRECLVVHVYDANTYISALSCVYAVSIYCHRKFLLCRLQYFRHQYFSCMYVTPQHAYTVNACLRRFMMQICIYQVFSVHMLCVYMVLATFCCVLCSISDISIFRACM